MDDKTLLTMSTNQHLGPLQINAYGDRFFYNLNPETFSEVSAHDLFETTYGKQLFNENTLYIIIGTDSCLLPRYIEKKGIPNGTRYIFIEPLATFEQLSSQDLFKDIDSRIACINMDSWDTTITSFKLTDYFYLDHVKTLNTFCTKIDAINAYQELYWQVSETLSQFKWHHNFGLGSEIFAIQQLANLANNQYPAILLKDAFEGKTAIILAGGPSLDEALPWVQKQRDKLIVFAVSRIAKRLQQVNLEPDFVVTIDPFPESFDISKEMLTFSKKTILLNSFHAVPSLVNQWPGMALYLGGRIPWESPLNCENISAPGPTVTNAALSAAYHLGCKRIILAGVDLCFTQEGFTHAKGSDEQLAGPRFNLTLLEVETNSGAMAPSRRDFVAAREGLSAQACSMVSEQCRIINVSPHAAKTEYVEYVPLTKIRLKPLECDVQAIVAERIKQHDDPCYFKKAITALRQARCRFDAIRQVTAKGKRCAKYLLKHPNGKENLKCRQALQKIELQLNNQLEPFSTYVKMFCIRSFLQITRPFNDQEKTNEEHQQTGIQFFQSYQQGTQQLIILIDMAIKKIQAREEEEKKEPNWAKIIHQCVIEKNFGRVRRWRQQWSEQDLSEHINSEFALLESCFVDTLANKDTAHFHEVQRDGKLELVKPRADLLFKQKKVDLLQSLINALDNLDDQSATIPYRLLIEGYCAELKLELPAALAAYHQLINLESLFMNDALLRVSFISISNKDYDNACLSMYCLAQNNPIWLPLCARMQQLRGDINGAVASYRAYVKRFPEDISVQLKLVSLCIQEQINDAAELLLNFILEKHPQNELAIQMREQLSTNRTINELI